MFIVKVMIMNTEYGRYQFIFCNNWPLFYWR